MRTKKGTMCDDMRGCRQLEVHPARFSVKYLASVFLHNRLGVVTAVSGMENRVGPKISLSPRCL